MRKNRMQFQDLHLQDQERITREEEYEVPGLNQATLLIVLLLMMKRRNQNKKGSVYPTFQFKKLFFLVLIRK